MPGTAEQEFIRRWFKEFGFDSMIVTEACNRTLTATGSASFPYADKILTGWKENGVRTLQDVETLDKRRQEKQAKKSGTASRQTRNTSTNRFNNFEQRSYNYDDYVWDNFHTCCMDRTGKIMEAGCVRMALSNSQYDAIMRVYNQRQFQDKREQDKRIAEVYEKVPQVEALSDEIAATMAQAARRSSPVTGRQRTS